MTLATRPGRALGVRLAPLVLACALAWVATLRWADEMGNGPGPMGLALPRFVGVWAVMMAAMMLPTLAVCVSSARRPGTAVRLWAGVALAAGYLAVWAVAGAVYFAAGLGTQSLAEHHRTLATVLAVALFAACAAWQVSPCKAAALRACSRPQVPAGPGPGLRAGVRCGLACLAASWALMALLLAFGFMNVVAMLVLAAAVLAERRSGRRAVSLALGAAALAVGAAVAVHPALAPGLHAPPATGMPGGPGMPMTG